MKVVHIKQNERNTIEPTCAALGFFDGLHIGHRDLLEKVVAIAKQKNLKKALMTFNTHPKSYVSKQEFSYLSTMQDKIEILEEYEFDYVFIIDFDELVAKMSPIQFIEQYIVLQNIKSVVCGIDYHFGVLGSGNNETLQSKANHRYDVYVVKQREYQGKKVSTSYIKELLGQGKVELVTSLLGRFYTISGNVIYGFQRGKKELGFATANIDYTGYVLPQRGVYAVTIKLQEKEYFGMANIGFNPTFGDLHKASLEVNIFDFDQDIYGEIVSVSFHSHIRAEQKFSSKEELIAQVYKNKENIEHYFNNSI